MNILIIEDDENKRNQLQKYVTEFLPAALVNTCKSLQSGLKEIIKTKYNLILLDMTLPNYDIGLDEDGGRIQPLAGRELLFQMERRDLEMPVIVITQFDRFGTGKDLLTLKELDIQLRSSNIPNYKGFVYYDSAMEGWKQSLKKLICLYIRKE